VIVLIGALLAAGLAGCAGGGEGGGPTPVVSPSVAPSVPAAPSTSAASPSPSTTTRTGPLTTGPGVKPGEKPPVESRFAKQHTEAGALAFAGYYFRALDWSLATTDANLLRGLSEPSCAICTQRIHQLEALRAGGGRVDGYRNALRSTRIVTGRFTVKSDYVVETHLIQYAGRVVSSSGAVEDRIDSHKISVYVFVSWRTGSWRVIQIGQT
jgi:hypothetical protein